MLSRNNVCWCGSGLKYKKCHLSQDQRLQELRQRGIPVPGRDLIKTAKQIEGIRQSSQLTHAVLDMVAERITAGISTDEINTWVHEYIINAGGMPATLNYQGFPKSVCTSLNEVICHGIPDGTVLKNGDIINVDVTSILGGYYGDASRMFIIGEVEERVRELVEVTRECMYLGIAEVKPFNRIGDIGFVIEQLAHKHGFSVVHEFGGHRVDLKFHEEPFVQHYGPRDQGMVMVPNMVFTVEPMINLGGPRLKILKDGWTTVTADGSYSAQWEHTVRVTETGVEILT